MKAKCWLPTLPWVDGASLWVVSKNEAEVRLNGTPQVLLRPATRTGYRGRGMLNAFPVSPLLGGKFPDHERQAWARYRFGSARQAALVACASYHRVGDGRNLLYAGSEAGVIKVPMFRGDEVFSFRVCDVVEWMFYSIKGGVSGVTQLSRTVLPALLDIHRHDSNARCNFAPHSAKQPHETPARYFFEVVTGGGLIYSNGTVTNWWRWVDFIYENRNRPTRGNVMTPQRWHDEQGTTQATIEGAEPVPARVEV